MAMARHGSPSVTRWDAGCGCACAGWAAAVSPALEVVSPGAAQAACGGSTAISSASASAATLLRGLGLGATTRQAQLDQAAVLAHRSADVGRHDPVQVDAVRNRLPLPVEPVPRPFVR